MDETTQSGRGSSGDAGPSAPKKGLPAWAWSLIGIVVGAALIGGAWMLYESGRSAGRIEGFGATSIETSATLGADAAESADASATADDTAVAEATDGSTSSGGTSSSGGSSGSGSSGSSGGSSSGSSSSGGSSGSGSSPGLPAPPTPITPSKPALKQKIPVSLWKTVATLTSAAPHEVYNWSTGATAGHVRVRIVVTHADDGNAVMILRKTSGTPSNQELFSTAHFTTGTDYTTPSIDLPANMSWRVGASTPDGSAWTITIQTRP